MTKNQVTWVIYGLMSKNDSEIRYVGKTTKRVYDRLANHKNDAKRSPKPRHLLHWMKMVGVENVTYVILEKCPIGNKDYLSYAERYWISSLKEMGKNLTNHTDGGEGTSGYRWSDESRKRLSESAKGRHAGSRNPRYGVRGPDHPMYGIKGENHPGFGYKDTPERLEAKRVYASGRTHSEESRKKISDFHRGKPKSEETKLKLRLSAHKRFHENRDILSTSCTLCIPSIDK